MKVKTKGFITGAAIVVLMALVALLAVFTDKPLAASAATTPRYAVAFNYSASYTYGSGAGTSQHPSSGIGVYSASFTYGANKSNYTLSVMMYGSSTSGTGTFVSGGFIDSTDITVEISSSIKMTVTIKDANGKSIGSGSKKATASNLTEGTYSVSISGSGGGPINSRAGWAYGFSGSFTFQIDKGAPTINGASTSTTGKYINSAFTVSATDSGSGVKTMYMKTPNNSTFYSVGTSTTVNKGSANGRYTFYAEDNAGNRSGYYYVNFDDTPPTMTCVGASFGSNTNAGFTVRAEDNSGSVILYRKLDDGNWIASGSSYTVSNTAEDGTYYFYAMDGSYGNKSSEVWVQLGAELSGEFVKSETDNSVYFTWDRSGWTATLDDKLYTKGAWIRTEGEHTIKLSSKTKSAVYPYKIDHYYVQKMEKPTCTSGGYLQYDCVQCGDRYTDYSIEETGHYYVASTTVATCTNGGYTVYTCTRCGDSYTDNYTNPLGHNYEATYMPATCTDFGKTVFTCQVCGSGYHETDGTYPTGHNYNNEVVTAPTCTVDGLRRSTCESCGHTFDTKISANGHNYNITESSSVNGKTIRTYTCTVCHHSYTQELGDQYEEVTNYVEYLFEQYEPYMWWVLLSSAGIWSIVIGVMIAIAHKNEEKEKAKKMLVNYVIGLVVIAVIVVACPFLIRGIAALVT